MMRSDALKTIFMDELKPHKKSLQKCRESLQNEVDAVKARCAFVGL